MAGDCTILADLTIGLPRPLLTTGGSPDRKRAAVSGRIRRLLRTVPKGRVDLGEVPQLVASATPCSTLSPVRWVARGLLAERLRRVDPTRCRVLGPGRLVDAATMPFHCPMAPLGAADGVASAVGLSWLVIGDALAAESDPPGVLSRLTACFAETGLPAILVLLPGTALLPDDRPSCPRRWLFSRASAARMAMEAFGGIAADVTTAGNALVASSEVLGLAAQDLWEDELAFVDPQYPVVVALTTHPPTA